MIRKVATALATTLVAGALSVGGATPAVAVETCEGEAVGHQTITVFDQRVLKTNQFDLWVCVSYPSSLPQPPSVDVTLTPARIVELVHPDTGDEQIQARLFLYTTDETGDLQAGGSGIEVPVPLALDGGRTCLLFQGNDVYNPGGCALAVNGVSTVDDLLNDILDDLPLP